MRSILLFKLNLSDNLSIKLLLVSDWISFWVRDCLAFFSASLETLTSFFDLASLIITSLPSFTENVFYNSFLSPVSKFVIIKHGIVLFS